MSSIKGFKTSRTRTDYRGELTPVVQEPILTQEPVVNIHLSTGQMIVGGVIGVVLLLIFLAIFLAPDIMLWTSLWQMWHPK